MTSQNTPKPKKNNLPALPELSNDLVAHEEVWLANFTSDQTRDTYKIALREFCALGQIQTREQLRDVSPANIITYRDYLLKKKKMAPRSVRGRMATISSLFKHLKEEQVVTRNPVENIKRPRVDQSKGTTKDMSVEQVQQLMKSINTETLQGARDYAILNTMFLTGCRVSEVANLKVEDLTENRGFSILNFTVKGGEENPVEVHPRLKPILQNYLEKSGHSSTPKSPMFQAVKNGKPGEPLTRQQLFALFKKYLRKAGLSNVYTPHTPRATFATTALNNGARIEKVQNTLKHKWITTTQVYDKTEHKHEDSAVFSVNY